MKVRISTEMTVKRTSPGPAMITGAEFFAGLQETVIEYMTKRGYEPYKISADDRHTPEHTAHVEIVWGG